MDYSAAIGWRYDTLEELDSDRAWYVENGYGAEYFDDQLALAIAASKNHDHAKTASLLPVLLAKYPQHAETLQSIAVPGLVGVE
jgi:hypothetical protein